MKPLGTRLDALRRSFLATAGTGLTLGLALGLLMPSVDGWLAVDFPLVDLQENSASSLLQTIGTVVMSVVGISFSVIVVALQLASQQLSPRVLRTFETNRLSQVVLALFVGTFIYCLAVLARLGSVDGVPELSVSVAIVLALVAFAFFVAFIHEIVNVLQASNIIRRIATDGQQAVERRFPADVGAEPDDRDRAEREVEARMGATRPTAALADDSGYVTAVDSDVVEVAARHGGLVRQRTMVGDFVVRGAALADVWCAAGDEGLTEEVRHAFTLSPERTVVQDVAFPIRQLADVALRGVSPSLNDPTTAENAMGFVADGIVRFVERGGPPVPIRVDGDGRPRFVARVPTLDDLVRLGFEQVGAASADYPVLAARLVLLLEHIDRCAGEAGIPCSEARRQAARITPAERG